MPVRENGGAGTLIAAALSGDGRIRPALLSRMLAALSLLISAGAGAAVHNAFKQPAEITGQAPLDSFLNELVAWGRTAPDEIFAPNPHTDIYSNVVECSALGRVFGIGWGRFSASYETGSSSGDGICCLAMEYVFP